MSEHFRKLLKWVGLINPNQVFLFMLAVFFIDSAVNFVFNIPIFVSVAMLILPLLWLSHWKSGRKNVFLLIFISLFILVSLINNFVYKFDKTNISDLVFILFFPTIYYFYKLRPEKLLPRTIHILFFVTMFMFMFAFAGINSTNFRNEPRGRTEAVKLLKKKKVKPKRNNLDVIERNRKYNYGLFRVPHLANYFWGFLFLFYGFAFQKKKKWYYLVGGLAAMLFMLYSGSRTFLVAVFLALMLYWIRRKTIVYVLITGAASALILFFRYELYHALEETFLSNYVGLLITTVDNFSRLSRAIIWSSWWYEMQHFVWYDFLIGKTFVGSMDANLVNIHFREWFHNDFLSISYAYGFFALMLYLVFFYKMFRENARFIRNNAYLFVFFFAMIFSAFFNGFYYYFPVFLIFIFVYMLKLEKIALKQ